MLFRDKGVGLSVWKCPGVCKINTFYKYYVSKHAHVPTDSFPNQIHRPPNLSFMEKHETIFE